MIKTPGDYWNSYLSSQPVDALVRTQELKSDSFGDSPEMATRLGALIYSEKKTATCSSLWEYQFDSEEVPRVGSVCVVVDGENFPLCIIETMSVEIIAYDKVPADFAAAEGEGDGSLQYWRQVHWEFFSRSLARIGREPSLDMPLVCERFRVVYR